MNDGAPEIPPRRPARGLRGRGAAENPPNRFERLSYLECEEPELPDPDAEISEPISPSLKTRFYRDPSRQILSSNESPDLSFDTSLNPYRGCEHGCIYCYARPTHEYLGWSAGLDFESRILVKERAPELLRRALSSPRWRPRVVAIGAVTDPYQPIEGRLRLTRRCLEIFVEFRNPVGVVTKSGLVLRDLDLLGELARFDAATVSVSITSLDPDLARILEPRAATPERRLACVRGLAEAGIPVGVLVAPVIPALNDHEIPSLVEAAAEAGAQSVGHVMLRLPHGVAGLFEAWLDRYLPERKQKILNRIRSMRGGRLNDSRFHTRHLGSGFFAEQTHRLFEIAQRRAGLDGQRFTPSTAAFRRPPPPQLSLF